MELTIEQTFLYEPNANELCMNDSVKWPGLSRSLLSKVTSLGEEKKNNSPQNGFQLQDRKRKEVLSVYEKL